ncbi:MAG TPA: hypothetical protein PLJ11_07745 [Methanomassiliicoccales archaeon]|nr:hypothetical protein [Methanomassiliicoccales archaeon]
MDGVRYQDLLELADNMAPEEIDYVMRGVAMNKAIAEYGLASESLSGLGAGKAKKLAEIAAALVLAGELSTLAAQAAGELGKAHKALGR